jgi:hypothetical protein
VYVTIPDVNTVLKIVKSLRALIYCAVMYNRIICFIVNFACQNLMRVSNKRIIKKADEKKKTTSPAERC